MPDRPTTPAPTPVARLARGGVWLLVLPLLASLVNGVPEASGGGRGAEALYERARARFLMLSTQDIEASISLYEKALEKERGFVPALAGLAEAHAFLGWIRLQAKEDYEGPMRKAYEYSLRAGRLAPASFHTRRARALYYLVLHRRAEAREEARAALRLRPRDPESLTILWQARGSRPDDPLIGEALRLEPGFVMAHLALARALFYKRGDYASSARHLREALARSPRLDYALDFLGTVERTRGNYGAAAKAYRKAIALNPNNASALRNLGVTLLYGGRIREAAKALKRALVVNPNFFDSHFYLARCYEMLGKKDKARRSYRRFLALSKGRDRYSTLTADARRSLAKLAAQ